MTSLAEVIVPSRLGSSFRWLLGSSWVTNLGEGITLAAGPLLVASQTRSPLAVAMAALLQRLPWLLFGVYLTGVIGGIVIGSAVGGLVASVWGITAPFWFAFGGSAVILIVIWRSLLQIAHGDEHARAGAQVTAAAS